MKQLTYSCQYRSHCVADTQALGQRIGQYLKASSKPLCIALVGDLGVGKTHLSQAIGQGFGVSEEMTSPTFALMNTYRVGRQYLYHFDLYRLESLDELETIGFYEYTEEQKSLVEWADKFSDELPDESLWIYIEAIDDGSRRIWVTSDQINQDTMREWGGSYVVGD